MSSPDVEKHPAGQASIEKERVETIEKVNKPATSVYRPDVDTSGIDEKKLLRKLDWTLIPWLSFLYLLSFLDRSSIGNAKLYGMEQDLNLTDHQYLMGLTIFFFSYAVFEVPSNVFLKRLRPSIWLSILMLLWGIMMTVQGLVHDYGGLLSTSSCPLDNRPWQSHDSRIYIQLCAGFLDYLKLVSSLVVGSLTCLYSWYKRHEFGIRAALFFSAATASGAFGGLLAAAIAEMDGIGGKPAWAWIFILEGLATVVAGVASFFIIQDFPDTARFLSEKERVFVIRRLQGDDQYSAAGEKLRWHYIRESLLDVKTWIGMLLYAGVDGPLYGFSLFLPSIINQLGYRATPANLLTVPAYVVACILTCATGLMADRLGKRGFFTLGLFCLAGSGYLILIFSRSAALSYFAVYLAACGIYPLIPNAIAWVSNNVEGSYKRSVSLGMVISFGNINGAVSSNVYRARDQPWYTLGHGIILMYIGMGFCAAVVMMLYLRRENELRRRGERDEIIVGVNDTTEGINEKNGRYATMDDARRDKGDKFSGYRYTL